MHGAVQMDSSEVGFCPVDAPPDIAAVLSASGTRLALRWVLFPPKATRNLDISQHCSSIVSARIAAGEIRLFMHLRSAQAVGLLPVRLMQV